MNVLNKVTEIIQGLGLIVPLAQWQKQIIGNLLIVILAEYDTERPEELMAMKAEMEKFFYSSERGIPDESS